MIGIVNYGLGNVTAFANTYKRLGIAATLISSADEVRACDRLILPGVGAFDWAMKRLEAARLREALDEVASSKAVPILGVCVGMQVLAGRSEEGVLGGLGWVRGNVRRFKPSDAEASIQLPHMGWNEVKPVAAHPLFRGLEQDARFYFLHSYYFEPEDESRVVAITDYHGSYASCVGDGCILGVQFHPEKSHQWGIQLLRNFAEM